MEIIKRFWILILIVIGGVFFIYNNILENIEQKKIYTEVCQKVLLNNSENCFEDPISFSNKHSKITVKKELPDYSKQVLEIKNLIEKHNNNLTPVLLSLDKYQYYSPNALSSKGGESEKIIIGGRATCHNSVLGFYFSLNKDKYHFCLTEEVWSEDKQDNIKDTTEVLILNIDEFPSAKEIYDLSDKLNFNLFNVNVLGEVVKTERILSFKPFPVKADQISFSYRGDEKSIESILSKRIKKRKREEIKNYVKKNYPHINFFNYFY